MTNHPHNLKDDILRKIREREISMRPQFHFTLRVAASVLLGLAILVISIFICNFILFSIRLNAEDSLLHFGPRGLGAFLRLFPWWLLLLDLGLIALLQSLLRQCKLGYRTPVAFVMLWLLCFSLAAGFLVDRGTPFNDELLLRADERGLPPPFNDVYGGARRMPPQGGGMCHHCTITAIEGNTLTVIDSRAPATTSITVVLPPNDPRATTTALQVGDTVFIAGDEDDGVIYAFGIRKTPPPR